MSLGSILVKLAWSVTPEGHEKKEAAIKTARTDKERAHRYGMIGSGGYAGLTAVKAPPEEESGAQVGGRVLGGLAAAQLAPAAGGAIGIPVMHFATNRSGMSEQQHVENVREMAKQMGISKDDVSVRVPELGTLGEALTHPHDTPQVVPKLVTGNRHLVTSPIGSHESLTAHEFGHVKNYEGAQALGKRLGMGKGGNLASAASIASRRLGSGSAMIGSGAAAFQKDPTWTPGLVNAATWAPALADEAGASIRAGAHLIKQHGLAGGLRRSLPLIPAFASYAGVAGAPLAITAIRKHLRKKEQQSK